MKIHTPNGIFERMYVCLNACKQGFLEGYRLLIRLDSYHLKEAFKSQQLLAIIGKDANDANYAIVYIVVDVKSRQNLMLVT